MNLKLRTWLGSAGLLASLLVCPVSLAQQADTSANPAAEPELEVISVTTRPLEEVWVDLTHRVSGEVVSLNHPQLSAQATGEVLSIEVETGDRVEKGAVLVSLDCRQSELNLAVMEDAYELALKEFKRSRSLQKNNAIAEQQFSQAASTLAQASIRKEQAVLSVEHCLILAPFGGVVTERQIQLGAVAVPGSAILRLLQTDAVEARVRLNREQLLSLQQTDKITFISGRQQYPLALRSVIPLVDSISDKQTVRLSIRGAAPFPGEPGDVVWQAEGKYLPVGLLVERGGKLGYFIEQQGLAHFIPLVKARLGHPARIDHEVDNPGAVKLIVEGRYRIEEGSRIRTQTRS